MTDFGRAPAIALAERIMKVVGLVAVPPELVERVREARAAHDALMKSTELEYAQAAQATDDIGRAERALADAIIEQLGGGR